MKIDGKVIGDDAPTYFIAEAGLNHNGDIEIAKKIIDEAIKSGADAVKFQTYQTEKFVTKSNQYFELFKNAELSFSDFDELYQYTKNKKITFFSAPFDLESADFLKEIDIPCIKIASSDLTNIPLISKIAKIQKPMIISTGASTIKEIKNAVNTCYLEGNSQISLMHCVSSYPTSYSDVNLKAIISMKKQFPHPIGYSDNGEPALVDLAAVSMGANLIEKHFTLDKTMYGPDHSFSIDPVGLTDLISQIRMIDVMKGDGKKLPRPSEVIGKSALRKSLTIKDEMNQGDILTVDNILIKRPEGGIEPKFLDHVVGKKINKNIKSDSLLFWKDIN
jgi:N,N'-diacetyllegionaminate synthase